MKKIASGLLFSFIALLLTGCTAKVSPSGAPLPGAGTSTTPIELTTIDVSAVKTLGSLAFLVADQQGYLAKQGIKLNMIRTAGGDQALKALTSKTVPLTFAGLVPFGFVGDKFPDVKLVTVLTDLNDSKFIARKDRLTSLQDLGGKKIGYSKSTVSDIHIKRLLAKYNIDSDSVQLINLSPAALPTAFAQGDIDAYASWEPNVANGAKLFSGNIIFTDTGDKYERYYSIFTDQTYAKQHPEIIAGILKAFAQANTYITEHQQESQELIATFLGLDKSLIAALWSDYHFDIGIKDTHTSALTDIFDRARKQQTDPSSTQSTIKDLILTP